MERGTPAVLAFVLGAALVSGCNAIWGLDDLRPGTTASTASTGAGAAGGAGGGGGTTGGMGGAGGEGGAMIDCSGAFGPPTQVLDERDGVVQSPAVSSDELELFYGISTSGSGGGSMSEVRRATRSARTAPFEIAGPDESLSKICSAGERPTLDLSANGLRAYVACLSENDAARPPEVWLVERPMRSAPFATNAVIVATAAGPSPAISADELELFTTGWPMGSPALMASRLDPSSNFGPAMPIPGTSDFGAVLSTPSLAGDGRTLFGFANNTIVFTTRPDVQEPFGVLSLLDTGNSVSASPEVSHDCRALYFVGIGSNFGSALYMIRR